MLNCPPVENRKNGRHGRVWAKKWFLPAVGADWTRKSGLGLPGWEWLFCHSRPCLTRAGNCSPGEGGFFAFLGRVWARTRPQTSTKPLSPRGNSIFSHFTPKTAHLRPSALAQHRYEHFYPPQGAKSRFCPSNTAVGARARPWWALLPLAGHLGWHFVPCAICHQI